MTPLDCGAGRTRNRLRRPADTHAGGVSDRTNLREARMSATTKRPLPDGRTSIDGHNVVRVTADERAS
jgi:hypothetical protein